MLAGRTAGFARWLRETTTTRASLNQFPSIACRRKCTIRGSYLNPCGTGGFELAFLGTSSQGGARRYPSCTALRLRGNACSEVWLFDAGEGAVAQLQRSNMRVGLVRNIFITHLHGDHLYGLPGLVMSVLGRRDAPRRGDATLNVYGPPGVRTFLRTALGVASFRIPVKSALRINELVWPENAGASHQNYRHRCASAYWKSTVKRLPFEVAGRDIEAIEEEGRHTYPVTEIDWTQDGQAGPDRRSLGTGPASVVAAPVLHSVPTFAYSVTENVDSQRFDKTKLLELGIPTDGREEVRTLFQTWLGGSPGVWDGQQINVEDVLRESRAPRRLCIVGDTYDASGATHIAQGVDVLVHEATNVAAQTHVARAHGHSSTLGATQFAKRVRAKRLILNHTSVSYSERKIRGMEVEARSMFGSDKAFVARDLSLFSVPTGEEDREDFAFRRFIGFTDSLEPESESVELEGEVMVPKRQKQVPGGTEAADEETGNLDTSSAQQIDTEECEEIANDFAPECLWESRIAETVVEEDLVRPAPRKDLEAVAR